MRLRAYALVAAIAMTACASPQTARPTMQSDLVAAEQRRMMLYALEQRAAENKRVYDIAEQLRIANAELCPKTERAIGAQFETLHDYRRDMQDDAREVLGRSERPVVNWLGAQSPATTAGVRIGDTLLAVNGREIRPGRRASMAAGTAVRRAAERGDVALRLQRGSETIDVSMTPVARCGYAVFVSDQPGINAFATGEVIAINRDVLQFARNDDEIALVLGHELAHNAMRHIDKKEQNAAVGAVGGAVLDVLLTLSTGVSTGGAFSDAGADVGAQMFSKEFEAEADYVGMYFVARAGFAADGVEDFWRRSAARNPDGVRFAYTHPNHAERFLTIAATRQEIDLLRAQGGELRPRMEGDAPVIAVAQPAATVEPVGSTAPVGTPAPDPMTPPQENVPNTAVAIAP